MINVQPTIQVLAGEARLMEQMYVVDAVCEAIEQFGQIKFAQAMQESSVELAD